MTNRTVALVGRPNVGKSRLFNRLAGRRIAIVLDQPGVTRDVNAVELQTGSGPYTLLDTGGIGLTVDMGRSQIVEAAEEQVFIAAQAASLICLVVDAREGLTPLDQIIAERLRTFGKTPLLVINKVDTEKVELRASEFARLGLGAGISVSAEHGYGEEVLREAIMERLPAIPEDELEPARFDEMGLPKLPQRRIRISFVGRPNVGKSSLCNALLQHERLVVSEVPGTTRDSIELDLDYKARDGCVVPFRLVDTAGMRRKVRIDTPVEYFSSLRSQEAITTSDVVFIVIDAMDGVTKQEQALLGNVVKSAPAVALLVNKWDYARSEFNKHEGVDGFKDERDFREKFEEAVRKEFFFLPDSPIIFVSAKTGYYTEKILDVAREMDDRLETKLTTGQINRLLERLFEKRPPRQIGGRRFKAYYATQTRSRPFTIRIFCNRAERLEEGYRRYLESGFIEEFALQGCPLRFELVGKPPRKDPRS